MTSMSDATRRAVATLATQRANPAPASTGMSVRPYHAPALAPELRHELDRALAGPVVLPGSGNGDAAMILHRVLTWHPDAKAAAEHLRDGMAPAPREAVEHWLATLAMVVANAPTEAAAVEMQCAAIWRLCGQLPGAVWSDESLDAYCDSDVYWPAPAALRQFMRARAELIERQIVGLEAIANAPHARPPARESTEPYNPGVPEWVHQRPRRRPLRERGDDDFDPAEAKAEDEKMHQSRELQFAALGFTRETVPPLKPREPKS
jgi:hypothetical protein